MLKITFLFFLIMFALSLLAEAEQIVYYDSDKVLAESKDLQEANTTLNSEIGAWEDEIAEIDLNIQRLETEYNDKKLILLPSGQAELENKILELKKQKKQKIQEIYGDNGTIFQRNSELITPIKNKLKTVIEKLAVENNYLMVLDVASGAVHYAKPKLDITDLILEEMEKTYQSPEEDNTQIKK
ncbi:MAG: OmpH family outer membrane protein [Candidatus Cloacimonetes bacterium]|nr:OmpH family outer membrane protein [Candidatus Cloacimonadota bacterium]